MNKKLVIITLTLVSAIIIGAVAFSVTGGMADEEVKELSVNTKLGVLLEYEQTKAILYDEFGESMNNPAIVTAKNKTLVELSSMAKEKFTDEALTRIEEKLKAIDVSTLKKPEVIDKKTLTAKEAKNLSYLREEEAKEWWKIMNLEKQYAQSSSFGVHYFLVPSGDLDAVMASIHQQSSVEEALHGAELFTLSAREEEDYYRVVWMLQYPDGIKADNLSLEENEEWIDFCSMLTSYSWYLVSTDPSLEFAITFNSPEVHNYVPDNIDDEELMHNWMLNTFADEFVNKPLPYMGVNFTRADKEQFDLIANNMDKQNIGVVNIGGEVLAMTAREYEDYYEILWINAYDESLTIPNSPSTWEQMGDGSSSSMNIDYYGNLETYEWFLVSAKPSSQLIIDRSQVRE